MPNKPLKSLKQIQKEYEARLKRNTKRGRGIVIPPSFVADPYQAYKDELQVQRYRNQKGIGIKSGHGVKYIKIKERVK